MTSWLLSELIVLCQSFCVQFSLLPYVIVSHVKGLTFGRLAYNWLTFGRFDLQNQTHRRQANLPRQAHLPDL